MVTNNRTRPDAYFEDGLPIYYNIYNENDGLSLNMSFRLTRKKGPAGAPPYGKILYDETHKLPPEAAKDPPVVQAVLKQHAPGFWRHFFSTEKHAQNAALFLDTVLNKEEGLPLSVVWVLDQAALARELEWSPKTIQRKTATFELLLANGWGAVPIGRLDAAFCGDTLLKQFSHNEHRAAVALLKQLAQHELGHKRLLSTPWPKRFSFHRPVPAKQSSSLVKQHIRPDSLTKETVHHIVDEMLSLLFQREEQKFALALLLCLTMGIPLQEACFIQMSSVLCDINNMPLSIHIKGAVLKKKRRNDTEIYSETNPKNRVLPIPTKVACAMKPILDHWKQQDSETAYLTRYLIPHEKFSQRKFNYKRLEIWINKRLRKQLQDNRMHDGNGNILHPRTPYRRCLATTRNSLEYAGFDPDEFRYFFGLIPSSTAGEFYCDFVNAAEQLRMRSFMDQWLGTPMPAELYDTLDQNNPPAETEISFGAKDQIAHIVLTLTISPVPEDRIPKDGYQLQFWAKLGFSLGARSQPPTA